MRVGGSRRHHLNPSEKKALSLMAKDAGEGGISDGGESLDEITAEDFRHDARGSRSRVWMPTDLMRYPVSRNFSSDIYSFAWAQAVQSKPKPPPADSDEVELDGEVMAADSEKEEGELEEGEIEIGSEPAVPDELEPEPESAPEMAEAEETDDDFDTRVGLILEELEAVTGEEAEISFDIVCSRLRKSFESLKEMFSDGRIPVLDALVQQAFMGIQTLHSVISSRNLKEKERNEDLFLRLLIHLKKQYSLLLTPEQIKEIDDMLQSLALDNKEKGSSKSNDATKVPTVVARNRVEFSPLVDLHAEYDEGSLPSPTRENALPTKKPVGFGTAAPAPNKPLPVRKVEAKDGALHSYDTDAFKAVSFYQQKYSRNSSVACTGLWSPTPSEESEGNDDTNGEVSSSSVTTLNSGSILQLHGAQTSSLKPKALTNCRDPRLRILNPEVGSSHACSTPSNGLPGGLMNSRKHKAVDDPVLVDQLFKKLRNATDSREAQRTSGKGGWLEETKEVESRKPGNGEIISSKIQEANTNYNGVPNPNSSAAAARAVMLPSLLKDVAVNPTILLQLIKMEQQRLAADFFKKPADSVPAAASSGNVTPMKPSELEQKPAGKSQLPTLLASMGPANDVGRIRMKPRDPRRVLHNNTVQKGESLKPEPTKINDRLTIREHGEQAQTADLPSAHPDIAQLFTTNLKSIADILSSSQSGSTPQNQTVPNVVNRVDTKSPDFNIQKSTPCDGATSVASQDPKHWENVDHLLDGYDDQDKAAIQKERARRIEEQNKMFSSRKLCLVLDLDHTLLNSAKFLEVDPIHDEILRKKEEQDREKPQRHLFRFQHMAMWTKLRPGIWTFLERASKLYELHLYTMGNNLYATEMAKVLDPTGRLFAGRVISRGDEGDALDGDERVPRSKDLDGVLGMESAVVIIDDSVRVWPLNKLNLIVVERYTYFPYSRRQFGLPGPSLLEIDHDERPEDGTLASSLAVIERIHHSFFAHRSLNDVDVRNILAAEQRKILSGCKIVFSRIFPVGEMNPHLHPLWQTAEQFGAVCTSQIDELVTHVVANSLGTDKVNWALSTGRFAVQPGWVEASALLYRRANEQDFAIKL